MTSVLIILNVSLLKVARQQRTQTSVELRKTKRDETLNKRRNVPIPEDVDEVDEAGDRPQLSDIVSNASSDDPSVQLAAVQSAR